MNKQHVFAANVGEVNWSLITRAQKSLCLYFTCALVDIRSIGTTVMIGQILCPLAPVLEFLAYTLPQLSSSLLCGFWLLLFSCGT